MEDELTNDNIMKAFALLEFTDEPATSEEKKGDPEGRFTVDKKICLKAGNLDDIVN